MLGVVNELTPLVNIEPPLEAVNQSILSPGPGVADIVTVPVEHLDPFIAVGVVACRFVITTSSVEL